MPPVPKLSLQPIAEVVKTGRGTKSQEDFAFEVREKGGKKISAGTVSQIESGRIRPTADTMEAIAKTVGIPPSDIAEYRLQKARDALDERQAGNSLEQALDLLHALDEAMRMRAKSRRSRAGGRAEEDPQRSPSDLPAPAKKRAT